MLPVMFLIAQQSGASATILPILELSKRFNTFLFENGFRAQKGQIIDANIIRVPTPRNNREENQQIKAGIEPEDWSKRKRCQKDTDAR